MSALRNAVGYVRLSELLDVDSKGRDQGPANVDQRWRVESCAALLGWRIVELIVEDDLLAEPAGTRSASAFKRRRTRLTDGRVEMRTVRPGFRKALDMLASGRADAFVALNLERAMRDLRDLEDLIDVVERYAVTVESVTGSLRLAHETDITMARVMVAMANREYRDKARQVSAARERQAATGDFGGGRRPFGFEPDGVTVRPNEAVVVAEMSMQFVQGASMRSLAAGLNERRVPTVTGRLWTAQTLRDILRRPRNAGRMVHRGEEIGNAPWEPIVPVETFRALQQILADPSRDTGAGAPPRWLGTNIFACGICTDLASAERVGVQVRVGSRPPAYRCPRRNHLVRAVRNVDALVVETVLRRLEQPDAVDLLPRAVEAQRADVAALRAQAQAIRDGLNELAADKASGLIDRAQLLTGTARGQALLGEVEKRLRAVSVESPLTPLVGAEDVWALWDALELSHRRLVVDTLLTVRILPQGRRGRGFDPAAVEIRWRRP